MEYKKGIVYRVNEQSVVGYDANGNDILAEQLSKWAYRQLDASRDMYEVLNDTILTIGLTLADHFPELRNKILKALAKVGGKE